MKKQKFIDQLDDITHASEKQIDEEHWHVEGVLRKRSNQKLKFDINPIIKFKKDDYGKIGHFNSKSDKIVFDFEDQWILIDTKELIEHVKNKQKKDLNLDDLLNVLSWNIILPK